MARQFCFEIYWPLGRPKLNFRGYLTFELIFSALKPDNFVFWLLQITLIKDLFIFLPKSGSPCSPVPTVLRLSPVVFILFFSIFFSFSLFVFRWSQKSSINTPSIALYCWKMSPLRMLENTRSLLETTLESPMRQSASISTVSIISCNQFETSKNETMNFPIHQFKVLHNGQRAFWNPFRMGHFFFFITLKYILCLAFSF